MTKLWPADAEERRVAVENCKYDKGDPASATLKGLT